MDGLASWVGMLQLATGMTELAVQWLVQSTLIIAIGLAAAALFRHRAPAVRSAIYQSTLLATLVCPVVAYLLAGFGWTFVSVQLPSAVVETVVEVAVSSQPEPQPAAITPPPTAQALPADDLAANEQQSLPQAAEMEGGSDRIPSFPALPIDSSTASSGGATPAVLPVPAAPASALATKKHIVRTARPVLAALVLGVSLAWVVGSLCLLGRILLQHLQLTRLRHGAAASDEVTRELCAQLAARMAVPTPHLLVSPFVGSPCLAGIFRPAILLPEELPNVPLSAVLVHELAHHKRHDCFWNLLRQVTVALLYLQPLAWRLSRRLEAVAEEVCDDYVVQLGEDRQAYAETLLNLAERNLWPASEAVVSLVTFRSVLSERVLRILDHSRRLSLTVGLAALCIIGVSGLSAALLAGLLGRGPQTVAATIEPTSEKATETIEPSPAEIVIDKESNTKDSIEARYAEAKAKVAAAANAKLAAGEPIDIRGKVLDHTGMPVPGAKVRLLAIDPLVGLDQAVLINTTIVDGEGRFAFAFAKQPAESLLVTIASAPGFGHDWSQYTAKKQPAEISLKLVPDETINGRIIDLEGQPVAGVSVQAVGITTDMDEHYPYSIEGLRDVLRQLPAHADANELPTGSPRGARVLGQELDSLPISAKLVDIEAVTGPDGKFNLAGVGRGRVATLKVTGGGVVVDRLKVVTLPIPAVRTDEERFANQQTTYYGSNFQHAILRSQPIEGVVRDAKTKEPLPGVRIWSDRLPNSNLVSNHVAQAVSDDKGRYRLEGMPPGEGTLLLAIPTDEQPYFMRGFSVPPAPAYEAARADVELHRGVWITGRVTDQVTGDPVPGNLQYFPWPDNVASLDLHEFNQRRLVGPANRYHADQDGRYRLVGLPGRGVVTLNQHQVTTTYPYPRGQGIREIPDLPPQSAFDRISQLSSPTSKLNTAIKEVRIEPETSEVVADIIMSRGKQRTVKIVDPAGQPLAGVSARGIFPPGHYPGMSDVSSEVAVEAFGDDEQRPLILTHEGRKLGKVLTINAPTSNAEPVTAQLEPCATITGRLVDNNGDPVARAVVDFQFQTANKTYGSLPGRITASDGRFSIDTFPCGVAYDVSCHSTRFGYKNIRSKLKPVPGETIDFGDFDITAKERPEARRTLAKVSVAASAKDSIVAAADAATTDGFDFAGQVLDTNGKPVAGAKLFVLYYTPTLIETKPRAISDAEGRFQFRMAKSDFDTASSDSPWELASVMATAPGYGMAWHRAAGFEKRGEILRAIRSKPNYLGDEKMTGLDGILKLSVDSLPIEGRVLDLEGQPVVGANLKLVEVRRSREGNLDAWLKAMQEGKSDDQVVRQLTPESLGGTHLNHQLAQVFPPLLTDKEGRFRLTGIGPERIVGLQLSGAGIETRQLLARTQPGGTLQIPLLQRDPRLALIRYYAAKFDHVAAPSRPVRGVVSDKQTGQPLVGVTVTADKLAGQAISGWSNSYIRATTDAEGRYELNGLPIGKNQILVYPTDDAPHLPSELAVETTPTDSFTTLDFDLHKGVWIRGRVTDAATGKPLRATIGYFTFPNNPQLKLAPGMRPADPFLLMTDPDGRYAARGLPGRGILAVLANDDQNYPRGAGADAINDQGSAGKQWILETVPHHLHVMGYHAVCEVNPAEGTTEVIQDFALHAGKQLAGEVQDADGQPLSGAMVAGNTEFANWRPTNGPKFTVHLVQPNTPRRLQFYHTDKKLAGTLLMTGNEKEPLVVRLAPWSVVNGRVLRENGDPADSFVLLGGSLLRAQTPDFGFLPIVQGAQTDAAGRFTIEGLAPGAKYKISAIKDNFGHGVIIDEFEVASGETKDLGDLKIHPSQQITGMAVFTPAPAPAPTKAPAMKKPAEKSVPPAEKSPAGEKPAAATLSPAATSSPPAADDERVEFVGTVLDARGKPTAGAKVSLLHGSLHKWSIEPAVETLADGTFKIEVPKKLLEAHEPITSWPWSHVIVSAAGQGVTWAQSAHFEKSGEMLAALKKRKNYSDVEQTPDSGRILQLVDDLPLTGRIVNLEGQGVAGLKVEVIELRGNAENNLDPWLAAVQDPKATLGFGWQLLPQALQGTNLYEQYAALLPSATTDSEGRFTLAGLGRERVARLRIRGATTETRIVYARTRSGPGIEGIHDRHYEHPFTCYGSKFDVTVAPSQPVAGTVRDADTGRPLGGVTIQAKLPGHWTSVHIETVTHADGHYVLTGLPLSENEIVAMPPADEPYIVAERSVETAPLDKPPTVDFKLKRGVWIEGRVADAETDKPLSAQIEYFAFLDNPARKEVRGTLSAQHRFIATDAEGRYRICVLPGPGLVGARVQGGDPQYPRGTGAEKIVAGRVDDIPGGGILFRTAPHISSAENYHAIVEINPPAGAEQQTCDLKVQASKALAGTLLDPQGEPLSGVVLYDMLSFTSPRPLTDASFAVYNLQTGKPRLLTCRHVERRLAGSLLLKGDETEPLTIQLVPWGTATGRLTLSTGDMAAHVTLHGGPYQRVREGKFGALPGDGILVTDTDGRFTIEGLSPGVNYSLSASKKSLHLGVAIDVFQVAPGETKDLGEMTLDPNLNP